MRFGSRWKAGATIAAQPLQRCDQSQRPQSPGKISMHPHSVDRHAAIRISVLVHSALYGTEGGDAARNAGKERRGDCYPSPAFACAVRWVRIRDVGAKKKHATED